MNQNKENAKRSLIQTITKMGPAVFTALIATGLGFVALYTSPVPMIQDFGKMLTIGLVISFILGLFLLIPVLFARDYFFNDEGEKEKKQKKKKHIETHRITKTDKLFEWITNKVIMLRWGIIVIAVITAFFGVWLDLDAEAETDIETFMPQDTQALKDIHKLRDVLGTTDQVSIVYESNDIMSERVVTWVDSLTKTVESQFPNTVVDTNSITNLVKNVNDGDLPKGNSFREKIDDIPGEQLKLFLNEKKTKGVITIGIEHLEAKDLKAFLHDLNIYLEDNSLDTVKTTITGKSVIDVKMIQGLTTGRYQMTLLGMGLVFLSLLLIYRQPIKAFVPLLPIVLIVGWSGLAMYFLNMDCTPLTATLGALIIGIGTEFTVLFMERFYEEKRKGKGRLNAIQTTNKQIGKAIFASALTTIGGFSALLVSDFVILNNFGIMTLINMSLALFSTIIVLPAFLIILDRFVRTKA
ncbi:MMPL family transporter [Lentibacillus cibarius]|uniref:MMPL family transporter n=1 Tax=Lentibacillus cibarius TaxID=2583219 RepID=A0A549YIP3_9BACI|nr:MMPL family transporter [Lentibacillus cibarius]TRM11741.1 MMPL family transporter [Lentibacillus cibarius]